MKPKRINPDELSEADAAELLGVTKATLANWRWRGYGPSYLKIGRRIIYLRRDLEEWSTNQRVAPVAAWNRPAS